MSGHRKIFDHVERLCVTLNLNINTHVFDPDQIKRFPRTFNIRAQLDAMKRLFKVRLSLDLSCQPNFELIQPLNQVLYVQRQL